MSDNMLLEVEDALRAQQIKALWDKFGQWLIGAVIIIVLGTAVGVIWHGHTTSALSQQTAQLLAFLESDVDGKAAESDLAALSAKTDMPLKVIAELYRAQKLEKAKDLKGAQSVYADIAKQGGTPDIMKDLAQLHVVRIGVAMDQKAEDLLPQLDKLTADDAPFRASAMELKGLLLQKQGKNDEANAVFSALSKNDDAPPSLRNRAKALISYEDKNAK